MANMQNYLGLEIKGFRTSVAIAKRELNSLKGAFTSFAGALGAGLGLGAIVSQLKDTATELSIAKATLENVSANYVEYAQNLEYVKKLSVDYKQDQIALIDSFAKFSAACKGTSMGLEEQKKVFESLTRAAAFFHMSADRTHDMLVAVEQMMSKGKVSAEELRRQLGNNLPGAFNLMAKAAGVSTAKLEDMMKKSQVISSEVLPKFAEELNKITENINLDSLQSSMNEMKNAWTNLTESSEFENTLKNIYSLVTKLLNWTTANLDKVKGTLINLAEGIIAGKLISAIIKLKQAIKGISLTSWLTAIITGFVTLINYVNKLNKKIDEFSNKLKSIKELENLEEKLFKAEEELKVAQDYVNDEKNIKKYKKAKGRAELDAISGVEPLVGDRRTIKRFEDAQKSIEELTKIIEDTKKAIEERGKVKDDGYVPNDTTVVDKEAEKVEKKLKKELDEYRLKVQSLDERLKSGILTQEEYQKELDKLAENTWEDITAFEAFRQLLEKLGPDAVNAANGIEQLAIEAAQRARDAEAAKQAKKYNDDASKINGSIPGIRPRDEFFDYKKTASTMFQEGADELEDYADRLKDVLLELKELEKEYGKLDEAEQALYDNLLVELGKVLRGMDTLKEKAKMAEWMEDVKELQETYNKAATDGIKNLASSLSSVTSGWKELKEVMEDDDASGWDVFITYLNEMIQLIETLIGLSETFNAIQEASTALQKAKNAATSAGIGLETAEAAASTAAASAKAGEAIAGATSSGAKLPFPYNLAAIAAGVSAVVAALAAMSKFANGGIVGGNSPIGDQNMIRANSGEMILTKGQQGTLFNAIKNGNFGSGDVQFKIKGTDLIGVINNTNSRIRG